MLVNNEIGVIQPVAEIAEMAHEAGALMLCDAVQGLGRVPIPDGPDLVAVSAHKIHGPKGIGALVDAQGGGARAADPWRRAGAGAALGDACRRRCASASERRRSWRANGCEPTTTMWSSLWNAAGPCARTGWIINGSMTQRYHGNLNIRREGVDAARLIADLRDIAFSLGRACASGSGRPSHVLRAIGLDDREARSSIRLGFGRYTTEEELVDACQRIDAAARSAGEARRVTLVRFFRADGTLDKEVEAAPGQRLLDVAWAARQPLEGACEGVMACSTCHVIVDAEDFERLPAASEEEEDLLDLAAHATRTSRLACQIILTEEMESARRAHSGRRDQLDGALVAPSLAGRLPTRSSGTPGQASAGARRRPGAAPRAAQA